MNDYKDGDLGFYEVMSASRPLKVRIVVEPHLLADLLVRLLATDRRDTSVGLGDAPPDIAVVSPRHVEELEAQVVIRLPDDEANAGLGSVTHDGSVDPVLIASIDSISRLLDLYAPADDGD